MLSAEVISDETKSAVRFNMFLMHPLRAGGRSRTQHRHSEVSALYTRIVYSYYCVLIGL